MNSSNAQSNFRPRVSLSSKTNHRLRAQAEWARSCATESLTDREEKMSDKDRQKKDGKDKNKKNQAMNAAHKNKRQQKASAPQQAKAQSNLTDTQSGAASNR